MRNGRALVAGPPQPPAMLERTLSRKRSIARGGLSRGPCRSQRPASASTTPVVTVVPPPPSPIARPVRKSERSPSEPLPITTPFEGVVAGRRIRGPRVQWSPRMSRQVRNVEQIRSLLRQMDRSVEDARQRREGVPRSAPQQAASTSPSATPHAHPAAGAAPSAQANGGQQQVPTQRPTTTPLPQRPMHAPPHGGNGTNPNPPRPSGPASTPGHGGATGGPNGGSNGGPERLKAKPKPRPQGNDPLQDFQQRQAS
jgi:hypothetical protein